MAQTSLAEQLKVLKVPSNKLLLDTKKKPSFLFDPKDAAATNRSTFYEIGISGLQEILEIDHIFEKFKLNLFDESSKNFERSIQTEDVNSKLNVIIKELLYRLSPYFQLKPSHKILEWLIHRFHIQDYNTDELICMSLPYHLTRLFARILQVFDLKESNKKWQWLLPLQKRGVPLSKVAIFNRCNTDPSFLQSMCACVIDSVEMHGDDSKKLSTLFAFYTTSIVGTLLTAPGIKQSMSNHILPSVEKGLLSHNIDYAASSLIIISTYFMKCEFESKIHAEIIRRITKIRHESLRKSVIMTLLIAYQEKQLKSVCVPNEALKNIIENCDWFLPILQEFLSMKSINIFYLILVRDCLKYYKSDIGIQSNCSNFIERLLNECKLNDSSAGILIKIIIDECHDIEDVDWAQKIVHHLERLYPNIWDDVVSSLLKEESNKSFSHLLGLTSVTSQVEVFEKLNHPNSTLRIEAIKCIAEETNNIRLKYIESSLQSRWCDDDPEVLRVMFSLPPDLQGYSMQICQQLLLKCKKHYGEKKWNSLLLMVIESLKTTLSDRLSENSTKFTVILIPLLVCSDPDIQTSILELNLPFMKKVKENSLHGEIVKSVSEIINIPFDEISALDLIDLYNELRSDNAYVFCILLLFSSTYSTFNHENRIKLLECVFEIIIPEHFKKLKIKSANDLYDVTNFVEHFKECENRHTPLMAAYNKLFISLLEHTPIPAQLYSSSWCHFNNGDHCYLIIKLYEYMSWLMKHQSTIRDFIVPTFIEKQLKTLVERVHFLLNLSIICHETNYVILESLEIMSSLLNKTNESYTSLLKLHEDNIVVPSLLILCYSEDENIRRKTMDVIKSLTFSFGSELSATVTYASLLKRILQFEEEIAQDRCQLLSVLSGFLSQEKSVIESIPVLERSTRSKIVNTIFDSLKNDSTPKKVVSLLLPTLDLLKDASAIRSLLPLARSILEKNKTCNAENSYIVTTVIGKFDVSHESIIKNDENIKSFFEFCLTNCSEIILNAQSEDEDVCLGTVILNKMSCPDLYAVVGEPLQKDLLKMALRVLAGCHGKRRNIIDAANKFIKKIPLDCEYIVEYLRDMKNTVWTSNDSSIMDDDEEEVVKETRPASWQLGIALLEILEQKKKLRKTELILKLLFDILTICCQLNDKSNLEYDMQRCIMTILNCSQKIMTSVGDHVDDEKVKKELGHTFKVDLIVNCIRTSRNPQTHQNALLLLAHCVSFADDQVLNHMMAIFTFMGSSVLRQDDAFSFQIITNILDKIVPLLVGNNGDSTVSKKKIISQRNKVLRVFGQSIPDIPEHRKRPLLLKLMNILKNGKYAYILAMYAFEKMTDLNDKNIESKCFDSIVYLFVELPVKQTLYSLERIASFANSFPHILDKDINDVSKRNEMLDLKKFKSNKRLQHLKYVMLHFVAVVLANEKFIQNISDTEVNSLKKHFREIIKHCIDYTKAIAAFSVPSTQPEKTGNPKYWKAMNGLALDILHKANALLPSDTFLAVFKELVNNHNLTIRRKSIELLNWRLQQKKGSGEDGFDLNELMSILPLIIDISTTVTKSDDVNSADIVKQNQQLAAMALKLLARYHFENGCTVKYKRALVEMTEYIEKNSDVLNENVMASLMLAVAELITVLKIHAIEILPKFVTVLLNNFEHSQIETNDALLTSLVVVIQKLVETLPNFLSPYLKDIIYRVVCISAKFEDFDALDTSDEKNISIIGHRLRVIRQKISAGIPTRILIPAVAGCFTQLCNDRKLHAIRPLMSILGKKFPESGGYISSDWSDLFLNMLELRCTMSNDMMSEEDISQVENNLIHTLCNDVVLKCSEIAFKPFYHKLFDWGLITSRDSSKNKRIVTYYRLLVCLSKKLGSIFVLFAGNIIRNSSNILNKFNAALVKDENSDKNDYNLTESEIILLVDSILSTLHNVFKNDSTNKFMTKDRFDILNDALVNQIENTIGEYEVRSKDVIIPCLARFAASTTDDSLWKQFNYSVLLKTRHQNPEIRITAIETVCSFASHIGDNFLPFLPETVPFLTELIEDENEHVEKRTLKGVQMLEEVLQEDIRQYFQLC